MNGIQEVGSSILPSSTRNTGPVRNDRPFLLYAIPDACCGSACNAVTYPAGTSLPLCHHNAYPPQLIPLWSTRARHAMNSSAASRQPTPCRPAAGHVYGYSPSPFSVDGRAPSPHVASQCHLPSSPRGRQNISRFHAAGVFRPDVKPLTGRLHQPDRRAGRRPTIRPHGRPTDNGACKGGTGRHRRDR